MFALLKKQVVTEVSLKEPSELTAIARLAGFASEKLDVAALELRAGFLASEAAGSHVIAGHIALTHASSAHVLKVETLIMTFADPIAWGNDDTVDTVVAVVVPEAIDTDAAMQAIRAHLTTLAPGMRDASANALEKLRRKL